jgi:hypothetical protein
MKQQQQIFIILYACCCAALLQFGACTVDIAPTAGGGSDLPNGHAASITGIVLYPDSTPAASQLVTLRKIVVTSKGDSILKEWNSLTNDSGIYRFSEIEAGQFTLMCQRAGTGSIAFHQSVEVVDSHPAQPAPMILNAMVDLIGYVLLPPGADYRLMSVSIPGLGRSVPVDPTGRYFYPMAPKGTCDMAFVYEDIVNYMRITPGDGAGPTVFLRDVEFAVMRIMASDTCRFYDDRMSHSFYITPKWYPRNGTPDWYRETEMQNVKYYNHTYSAGFDTWLYDTTTIVRPYDLVISGTILRRHDGTVVLTATTGESLILTGEKLAMIGEQVRYAVVALRMIVDPATGRARFEVMDIRLQHPGS